MTDTEQAPAPETEGDGRIAGGCVLAIALTVAGGVAYAVPESAYFVAGLLATNAVHKGRVLAGRLRRNEEQETTDPVDIVATLQGLAEGGRHVRLTQLAEAAALPDTKAVRLLLNEAGIRIRDGVRAAGKNGPGVHHDDVPPLPDSESGAPSERCLCRSDANTNANSALPGGSGEGLRVEAIGQAASVIRDPSEHRAHEV